MDTEKELAKDITGALVGLRQPAEVQFVEFKRICLANIERIPEISKGIRAAILSLEPCDTKTLFYLMDFLLCEMPLLFEDHLKEEVSDIVALKMPWVAEHAGASWGPKECRALVDSWRVRGIFNDTVLEPMESGIKRAIENAAKEARTASISPVPAPHFAVEPAARPQVSPQRQAAPPSRPAEHRPAPAAAAPAPAAQPVAVEVKAQPAAPEPVQEEEEEDDFYDPLVEVAEEPTDLAKQLDAANEERKRAEKAQEMQEHSEAQQQQHRDTRDMQEHAARQPAPSSGYRGAPAGYGQQAPHQRQHQHQHQHHHHHHHHHHQHQHPHQHQHSRQHAHQHQHQHHHAHHPVHQHPPGYHPYPPQQMGYPYQYPGHAPGHAQQHNPYGYMPPPLPTATPAQMQGYEQYRAEATAAATAPGAAQQQQQQPPAQPAQAPQQPPAVPAPAAAAPEGDDIEFF